MKDMLIKKWKLSSVHCIFERQNKGVYMVNSEMYGDCILKIDTNDNLKNVYNYLRFFDSNCVCKAYDYDERGGLLLAKITPGTSLRNESSLDKRLAVYHQLSLELHQYTNNNNETYLEWFNKLEDYFKVNYKFTSLYEHVLVSIEICKEMFSKYDSSITLHGDLHHDNILLNENNEYVVIDPKGVRGPAILEVGRFILNEVMMVNKEHSITHIKEVIRKISSLFDYDIADVCKVFYMETVLANAWNIEDGIDTNEHQLNLAKCILKWSNEI